MADRYSLPATAAASLASLVAALAREPDPPTTIREPADVIDRHLADSLEGLRVPSLAGAGAIADLGSGAGFPGLPLAIALPGSRVDLVESQRRKCETIRRLAAAAGVANARAVPARAEEWARAEGRGAYDAVTARAVASLAVLVEYAAPLLRQGGVLVAWKGRPDPAEEAAAAEAARLVGMEVGATSTAEPFPGAARSLYVYLKVKATPDFLPRRAGMATKRPLIRPE